MTSMVQPEIVGHRGSREGVYEHTLGAFTKAIADGVDALECDIRLTADGQSRLAVTLNDACCSVIGFVKGNRKLLLVTLRLLARTCARACSNSFSASAKYCTEEI